MPQLFTFILEFRGGTYISQYRGRGPREAFQRWLAGQAVDLAGYWHPRTVNHLFQNLAAEVPVSIKGVVGVWCVMGSVPRSVALLNIVRSGTFQRRGEISGAGHKRRANSR